MSLTHSPHWSGNGVQRQKIWHTFVTGLSQKKATYSVLVATAITLRVIVSPQPTRSHAVWLETPVLLRGYTTRLRGNLSS